VVADPRVCATEHVHNEMQCACICMCCSNVGRLGMSYVDCVVMSLLCIVNVIDDC